MSTSPRASNGRGLGAAALAVLTLIAGCDEGAPPDQGPAIKIANPHHDQLAGLSPDMQRLGLMRAVRDNGRRCKRVESVRYQQDYRQMALWLALCEDDRQWAIFIAPNGDTQVRQCTEMRELDLPECEPLAAPDADGEDGG